MALTVEDGSDVAGANAYVNEAFVTTYLQDRGRKAENGWNAADSTTRQAAIIKATDYVEQRFRGQWRGRKKSATQDLSWPRSDARDDDEFDYADDTVPASLKQAVAEYAVRALATVLLPDPSAVADHTSGTVTRIREKAGEVERDLTFSDSARLASGELRRYPAADLLIAKVTNNAGLFGRVEHA